MLNRFQLIANIIERDPVRYTPSGVPIVNFVLQSKSEVIEAGVSRRIELIIPALAAGDISKKVVKFGLGTPAPAYFDGFLARKHRNGKNLIFHITALQGIEKTNHGSSNW
ncbi:primosomal replication protein N [Candidatus Vallotia cooleyia]|uniref:primosomal replication protein N n=1 Tax=Candidatus Vallotiella adelgis TaxID=1177211 RepID=UPI001D010FA7|nr:primosomal replication protein N [Candidatus Vallotia cooleyia]UDG81941.1 Primosomal replication protein N [Candidatus Vallotia cooleyia]